MSGPAGRLVGLLLVAAGCRAAPTPPATPKPDDGAAGGGSQVQALAALLDSVRVDLGAPGGILGVYSGRGVPLVVASGLANLAEGRPLTESTPYFLGSISKTYTAATVLRLVEEGRVALDDPIQRFLPSFPETDRITVRQLLRHTSGLKDFYAYLYYRPARDEMIELVTKRWTEAELLALSARFGRWFEPGTDWSYSSTNYYLLGVIVERASGLSLPAAYHRFLHQPLGNANTWLALHEPALGSLPTGYLGRVASWKHSEMFGDLGPTSRLDSSSVEWGAGGIAATAADALRFINGLFTDLFTTSSSLQAMTSFRDTPKLGIADSSEASGESDGYGLGLVRMNRRGVTLIGHGGLFTGHTAGLWYIPACGVGVALYFNRGFVDQRSALDRVLPLVTRSCGRGSGAQRRPEEPAGRRAGSSSGREFLQRGLLPDD